MEQQTEYRMGSRCHICTGCGRCVKENRALHVLTEAEELRQEALEGGGYSVIADIGTTTIAMQLYDGGGKVRDTYAVVNPQTEYGADVLSRIEAAQNPADAKQMRRLVHTVLEQGLQQFRDGLGEEESLRMVIAANTTMVYLLMGWNPTELGQAPFHATHLELVETQIAGVSCTILPGLSAFVGGDVVAGILACGMAEREEITLLIDLGTNGEIVLGNRAKRIACATAAGPAFEGGANRGVWGADMISLLARLCREKIVDETGLLAEAYFEQGIRIGDVCVTQEAIRAIQLAKAAIAAGIQVLVQEYGITLAQIDRVVLAGGFGYHLDPKAAAEVGLLPKELVDRTVAGGNTALAGAMQFDRRRFGKDTLDWIKCTTKNINLAEKTFFYDMYIVSMNLF